MKPSPVYFPGLNGLRFFAALAVVFTHVELMKKYMGFDHLWIDSGSRIKSYAFGQAIHGDFHWLSPLAAEAGPLGVIFFFVLSGFLITYLLLREKESTGRIAVRKFYLRRILRIWPLYFFVFLLGFFVLPHLAWFHVPGQSEAFADSFRGNFWCYLFFVPNLAYSLYMAVPNIGQSWSIGVEEQFYILWPLIIGFFRKSLSTMVWFTVLFLLLKAAVLFYSLHHTQEWLIPLRKFLAMSKLECMSFGGLGGYLLYTGRKKWLDLIYSRSAQILAFALVPLLVYFTPARLQDGVHLVYSFCFLVIILNVAANSSSLLKLENNLFHSLGQISYGIYMYHLMCVVLAVHIVAAFHTGGKSLTWFENGAVYVMSIVLTLFISYISYRYFESRFIRLKKRVTLVSSGRDQPIVS